MSNDKLPITSPVSDPAPDGLPSDAALSNTNPAEPLAHQPDQPLPDTSASAAETASAPALSVDAPPAETRETQAAAPDETLDARTRANRENAQKSTGAKTPEGRAASSRNAVKHGLFAQDLATYFRGDDFARYERFISGIVADLRPKGDLETVLARRAADIQFRLEMLRTAELRCYANYCNLVGSLSDLISKSKDPIALVSLYDSRFQRSFRSTMDDLRKLQQARRDEERQALEALTNIAAAHLQQNATFDPTKFGFVISRDLIFQKAHLQRVQKIANGPLGDGRVDKMVVTATAKAPEKAA
jgi:hypothetical protein